MLAEGKAGLDGLFFPSPQEKDRYSIFKNCVRRVPDCTEVRVSFSLASSIEMMLVISVCAAIKGCL